jgi:hypothetical protein
MREYQGDFEVHLTVRAADEAALARFRAWCGERGVKCVRIVLARGAHVEQPMATWRTRDARLSGVRSEAAKLAAEVAALGLPVVRAKVEADPDNAEVPQADADAPLDEPRNYFEHHVKLLRDAAAPRESLLELCERHGAHLSRNALRPVSQGREERFVTLRSYGVGRESSELALQALLADLAAQGEQILEHESEYCVYDSNLELDAGWLTPAGSPSII